MINVKRSRGGGVLGGPEKRDFSFKKELNPLL